MKNQLINVRYGPHGKIIGCVISNNCTKFTEPHDRALCYECTNNYICKSCAKKKAAGEVVEWKPVQEHVWR